MPGIRPAATAAGHGKRYGMLVDMRKCIGCQSCTVSCSLENQPPVGQFRTTVLQYEVVPDQGQAAMVMLPRLCNHCDNPPCVPVCPVQATPARGRHRAGRQRALRGLRLLRAGLSV